MGITLIIMEKLKISEVGKGYYILKTAERDLHRNTYVKVFVSDRRQDVNMVLDPGSPSDVPLLENALEELIGGFKNIDMIFLSHQDPDVTSDLSGILARAPNAVVLASVDTWRLIRMIGLPEERFIALDNLKTEIFQSKTSGHKFQPVPARFCHFRGAMMLYDFESRILYSGDFLAGVNTKKGDSIYADETSWPGIASFHQIYMPTKRVVRATVDRIKDIDPPPKIIAPQHGDVITGEYVEIFLTRLRDLDVGIDIVCKNESEKESGKKALTEFLNPLADYYPEVHKILLFKAKQPGGFTTYIKVNNNTVIDIKVSLNEAILYIWETLKEIAFADDLNDMKFLLTSTLTLNSIAIPREMLPLIRKSENVD